MIEFRQKEFVGPFLLAAAPAVIQGGADLIQGKKANESQERIAEEQNRQAALDRAVTLKKMKQDKNLDDKKIQAANQQQDKIINLAKKNPNAAAAVNSTITVGQPGAKTFSSGVTFGKVAGKVGEVGLGALNSGAITTAMNMKANKDQIKSNEKIAAQENANKRLETLAKMQENNNSTAIRMQELKNSSDEFNKSYNLAKRTKAYSEKTKEALGFVKNIGTLAKERGLHKAMAGALVSGAVAGGGAYLVDKAIQRDMKKSGDFRLAKPELSEEEEKARKKSRRKKAILSGLGAAATVGGVVAAKKGVFGSNVSNIANKYVSKDSARKAGSILKDAGKDYFTHIDEDTGKRKLNKLSLAFTGASLATPAVTYAMKKKQYKDQIKQSEEEKTYSKKSGGANLNNIINQAKKSIKSNKSHLFNNNSDNKSYNGTPFDIPVRNRTFRSQLKNQKKKVKTTFKGIKNSISNGWKGFKEKPGESILGAVSSYSGGGGRKGVSSFGSDLEDLGKRTENKTSQKVGKFIKENPKTALAGSIVVGGVAIRRARNKVWNTTNRVLEKADPNAFAYSKYGAQPINGKNKDEGDIKDKKEENNG